MVSSDRTPGMLDNLGGSLVNDCSGSPVADYAEMYPTAGEVGYMVFVSTSWADPSTGVALAKGLEPIHNQNINHKDPASAQGFHLRQGFGGQVGGQGQTNPNNQSPNGDVAGATLASTASKDDGRIKVLSGRVDGLETRIENQESRIKNLEDAVAGLAAMTPHPDPLPVQGEGNDDTNNETIEQLSHEDLTVLGKLAVEGSVHIVGEAEFANKVLFNGLVAFAKSVTFEQDVEFKGRVTFNGDTAGTAIIKKGAQRVTVGFITPYEARPLVNVTLTMDASRDLDLSADSSAEALAEVEALAKAEERILEAGYSYVVTRRSSEGFTLVLNKPAEEDLTFSWVALAAHEAPAAVGEAVVEEATAPAEEAEQAAAPVMVTL